MRRKMLTSILAALILAFGSAGYAQDLLMEKGLAYLASMQDSSKDVIDPIGPSINPLMGGETNIKGEGSWAGNTGITALVLQAFIANGHGINDLLYGTHVTNAINFILSDQITDGHHAGAFSSTTYGYGTAMAIVALKWALDLAGLVEPKRTEVENAIGLAMNYYTQDINPEWTQVSWRYNRSHTSPLNGDMSVNQWVYLALDATRYNEDDIWHKVFGYIDTKKASEDDLAWIGYTSPGTWTRGNTCAGIWGLRFAHSYGVPGANDLATMMYNFLEQNSLEELFDPVNISQHVFSGGGYYYYIYELAKALTLGDKTNFAGGPWYNHMYELIDSQKETDDNGNFYWTGWGSGVPTTMSTALALLSLQTGTVPPQSTLAITLEDKGTPADYTEFTITNEEGYNAKVTPQSTINNIEHSQWINTSQAYMHWEIDLDAAGNYNTLITNNSDETQIYELCFRAYLEGVLIDEECFAESKAFIVVEPGETVATSALVNAIGGLNIVITNPPAVIPTLEFSIEEIAIGVFDFNETYSFQFTVSETGGNDPLKNIDIFASNLVDELGNVIPAANFTLTPNTIAEIPAGGSVIVNGTLVTPASFDKADIGLFQGIITAQTTQQSKGIMFKLGQPAQLLVIPVSNWAIAVSILLIISTIAIYLRLKRLI